jgi:heme A synthase
VSGLKILRVAACWAFGMKQRVVVAAAALMLALTGAQALNGLWVYALSGKPKIGVALGGGRLFQ